MVWLALSRFGNIPLGRDDEQPEFRTISWIAMMFSAGMGIGLMFYGVAEPLSFFTEPPPGSVVPGDQVGALNTAMATSLFHWTLHPWAIYAVVGLAIAYSTFRKGRRQLISSAFIPLIGEKADNGVVGRIIDIIAIFATIAAGSGVLAGPQAAAGIAHAFVAAGLLASVASLVALAVLPRARHFVPKLKLSPSAMPSH